MPSWSVGITPIHLYRYCYDGCMKPIADYLKDKVVSGQKRTTERGELLKKFAEKTGKPLRYIAFRLTKIPTADLYFIEKKCDTYKGPWGKAFFGMLKTHGKEEE